MVDDRAIGFRISRILTKAKPEIYNRLIKNEREILTYQHSEFAWLPWNASLSSRCEHQIRAIIILWISKHFKLNQDRRWVREALLKLLYRLI